MTCQNVANIDWFEMETFHWRGCAQGIHLSRQLAFNGILHAADLKNARIQMVWRRYWTLPGSEHGRRDAMDG